MDNRIEKRIELKAPVSRVWPAITNYKEFGAWFLVAMEAPFVPGEIAYGQITHPGYEHIRMQILIKEMVPERLFSFHWIPYGVDPKRDYTQETPTLVEFTLEPTADGTLLGDHRDWHQSGAGRSSRPRRSTPERWRAGHSRRGASSAMSPSIRQRDA